MSSQRLRSTFSSCARQDTRRAHRLGKACRDAAGFSLIELLVVMLIIGVLAAIAIPSFLNQKGKAQDAQAKELARSAETTAETIASESDGDYSNLSPNELNKYEPTIRITPSSTEAFLSNATSTKTSYSVTATATNGDELTIARSSTGVITRQCVSPVSKTGCGGSETSSW